MTTIREGAKVEPTHNYALLQLSEERHSNVGSILLGYTIPLYSAEFELYKTYKLVQARLEQQQSKGI